MKIHKGKIGIFGLLMLLWCCTSWAAVIQLTWSPNSESDLAGYKLYYGTASGSYGAPVVVGNVTSYALSLSPTVGTTYYFAVSAYDTSGNESVKSDEVSAFVPDSTPPAKPTGILSQIVAAIVGWWKGLWS